MWPLGPRCRIQQAIEPSGAAALARCQLASDFLDDLRRLDAPAPRDPEEACGCGQSLRYHSHWHLRRGPVVASTVIGTVADVSRFPSRDPCNGTAPIEASSGSRTIYRLGTVALDEARPAWERWPGDRRQIA